MAVDELAVDELAVDQPTRTALVYCCLALDEEALGDGRSNTDVGPESIDTWPLVTKITDDNCSRVS